MYEEYQADKKQTSTLQQCTVDSPSSCLGQAGAQRSYKDIPMLFPLLPPIVAPVEVIPVKALFGQVALWEGEPLRYSGVKGAEQRNT